MRCIHRAGIRLVGLAIALGSITSAATLYLDGALASNCTSGNYSIAARDCSGSDGKAFGSIDALPLAPGDTLLIRGCPDSTTNCPDSRWKYVGPLVAPGKNTISSYNDELVLVCSNRRACQWSYPRNAEGGPDMWAYECSGGAPHWCEGGSNDGGFCSSGANCPGGACTILNAQDWYDNEAVRVRADSTLEGIKTWGAVFAEDASRSVIRNNDLGGCGARSMGNVIRIENSTDLLIQNNFIHHSCKNIDGAPACSFNNNAWAVFGWDFTMTMENNELWDYFQGAIRLKDVGDANRPGSGGDTIVRRNYIRDSSYWKTKAGEGPFCFAGVGGDVALDNVYFYQNICYRSSVKHDDPPRNEMILYNNTFIDAYEASWSWHVDVPVHWYNTISYVHTEGNHHFGLNNNDMSALSMNANLYWRQAAGYGRWHHNRRERARKLSAWRSYTASVGHPQDELSVEIDPQFVNLACMKEGNCLPQDFKRLVYNENFAPHGCGSIPYGGATGACGARAGAYISGDESIGVDPDTNAYWELHHPPAVN
jgi:hypothetical protein